MRGSRRGGGREGRGGEEKEGEEERRKRRKREGRGGEGYKKGEEERRKERRRRVQERGGGEKDREEEKGTRKGRRREGRGGGEVVQTHTYLVWILLTSAEEQISICPHLQYCCCSSSHGPVPQGTCPPPSPPPSSILDAEVNVAQYQSKIASKHKVPCDACIDDSSGPAVGFCCECLQFLCQVCCDYHKCARDLRDPIG